MRYILAIVFATTLFSYSYTENKSLDALIKEQIELASEQYKAMHEVLQKDLLPRTTDNETGELLTSESGWWCSGFYPGTLWYLYEFTGDQNLKDIAGQRTSLIGKEQFNKGTHDLGFMINNSYGHAYRLTGKEGYKEVMINGAYSLLKRYHEPPKLIRSWDHGPYTYPVIIDNMMNLEYLMWAFKETGDSLFYKVCINHSDNTLKNHFRKDFSSFHLVDYDTITGEVIRRQTVQGYADESAWARGQAWGFYGYITMYRETGDEKYLDQAVNIGEFMLGHPNMPEDGIPYWDFNAPDIPEAKRDASAGAILASGLIELSQYVDNKMSEKYLSFAEKIVRTLSSSEYRSNAGENNNFLLKHSVGHLPIHSEVDVPLTYADYYYVEALLRFHKLGN